MIILLLEILCGVLYECMLNSTVKLRINQSLSYIIITLVTSLLSNHSVASESELARDQCQRVAVTPSVNLNVSFLSRVSRHLTDFIVIDNNY